MTYGICKLSTIPVRKESRHGSEMVSQLLYNETYMVLDKTHEWVLIRFENGQSTLQLDPETAVEDSAYYQGWIQAKQFCEISEEEYNALKTHPEMMVEYAKQLLGAPYLWGGRCAMGIDCSGLTQVCARLCGLLLPRDANQQIACGDLVYFLQETQPGDLAFFGDEDGRITHVGIVMDGEQIIHASGEVRIDFLDQTGIFNKDKNEHTHRLQAIKRLR